MVAVMILAIGVELLHVSINRLLHPEPVTFSPLTLAILIASILGKIWLSRFNRAVGRRICSAALIAAAQDSRNDVAATSAVLLGAVTKDDLAPLLRRFGRKSSRKKGE